MSRAVAIAALALLAQAAFSAGFAAAETGVPAEALAGQIFEQRKDVDEVSRPLPPSGPATPIPFCSPSAPICP